MEDKRGHAFRSFVLELLVYGALVIIYVVFVITAMESWLHGLYDQSKTRYAVVALLLIIGQGVVLEMVTSFLLRLIRSRT
jgi:hypothetical protein